MQVNWVCLSLCLMSMTWGKWIFPENNGPSPPATIAHIDSSRNHRSYVDTMRPSESFISLTSILDPKPDPRHELDLKKIPPLETEEGFLVTPAVKRLRYGIRAPAGAETTIYGLKVPLPTLNSLPIPPPPPPPPPPRSSPSEAIPPHQQQQPLVLSASSYSDEYVGLSAFVDTTDYSSQYNPLPLESFSPSVNFGSEEAFQPSTYFVQTEAPPIYYPPPNPKEKIVQSQYKYPTVTINQNPTSFKSIGPPKRHVSLPISTYKEYTRTDRQYDLSPKYEAPASYNTPAPQRYETPAPYKYNTPEPHKYNTPPPYKHNTPAPYKYNTPAPHRYNTPSPYKHEPQTYKAPVYKAPEIQKSYTSSSKYTAPSPHKHNTPSSYKHEPQKYKAPVLYKAPEIQKSYTSSSRYTNPSPHKHNTPSPYKHEPQKYKAPVVYKAPEIKKSYISSSYDVPKSHSTDKSYEQHKPKKYDYQYNVGSAYHGTAYRHEEKSDGDTVHGEYRVRLPDGRLQVVTYTADHENGFVPKVRYEGPQLVQAADIHFQPPTPTQIW